MNLQKYASLYASFHKCQHFTVLSDDTIVLSFQDTRWEPWLVLRLHEFDKITRTSQLAKSLNVFFNSDSQNTTFLKQDSWTMLLGCERVVFPQTGGQCKVYATPYFVSDPRVVDEYLRGSARPFCEHVYTYKNTILYLDPCDVPFPGGCYFDQPKRRESYRLCFVSREPDEYVAKITNEWKHRQGVSTLPFHVTDTTVVPSFIDFRPVRNLSLPDEHSKSTGTLRRHVDYPSFVIQDVLLSYLGDDEDQVHHLGLILEWPFRVQYDGSRCNRRSNRPKQFVTLSINGSLPKNVLYVRDPYERYVEYDYVPQVSSWTEIYFVRDGLPDLLPVVIDSVVIGFEYKGAFLCLSHPLLEDRPRHPPTQRTECLLTTREPDSGLVVLDTFSFDCETLLHRVKPKGPQAIQWDLWCLSKTDDSTQYPKRVRPPSLVEKYLTFYASNKSKNKWLGNVHLMQLATVLAKHDICFKTRIVEKRKGQVLLANDEIILQMERPGVDFLNSVRLVAVTDPEQNEDGGSCTVL